MYWIETLVHPPECIENFASQLIYLGFYKAYKDSWNSTHNTPVQGRIFDEDFLVANFSCFCFLYELPTNKATLLASRHTLKPTDISGSTKRIKTVERVKHSPYKTEFSVDFHDAPSISRFSLVLANFSCIWFRHDYRQTKRLPHSLSRSQHSTLSNQLITRVLKCIWRWLKQ